MSNDCIQGYFKTHNGKRYGPYLRKKSGKCKFTAKSITRLMIHARLDGVTDSELLHAWAQATNNKSLLCSIASIWQVMGMTVIIGAIIGIIRGLLTLIKGLKIVLSGKKSRIASSFIELVVPAKYWEELGGYLMFIGSAQVVLNSFLWLMNTVINDMAMRQLVNAACKNDLYIMPINMKNTVPGVGEQTAYAMQEFNAKILECPAPEKGWLVGLADSMGEDFPASAPIYMYETLYDFMTAPIKWAMQDDVPDGELPLPPIDYSFSIWDSITGKYPEPIPHEHPNEPPPIIPPPQ